MSNSSKTITRSRNGTARREVLLDDIVIPDLWHIARGLESKDAEASKMVMETWKLAHDLLEHLKQEAAQ